MIQDLNQTGLVSDDGAQQLLRATVYQLIAREGSIRGLPAVKAVVEQAAAAVHAAQRTKDAYHEMYILIAERFNDFHEVVSAAKCREEQANDELLSRRKEHDMSVAQLKAVQLEVHYVLVNFYEPSGHTK